MAKRKLDNDGPAAARHHSKRQKIPTERVQPQDKVEIHNAQQIRHLLVFHQGDIDTVLYGIHSVRNFLNGITDPQDEDNVPRQRAILREYLDLEKPNKSEEKSIYCADLIQSWSFAQSSNHDNLFSAVSSLFATLVRVLSSHLDLLEHGKGLCRTLLKDEQLKLISRGLSALKHKAHVIGPCLRLLTEIVSLDGGALARQLYTRREHTFDAATMARNLHLTETKVEEPADVVKKPSIRTHAIRYLLANLRYQNDAAKSDMLKQNNVWSSLFSGLSSDYYGLVLEILSSLDKYVIADRSILRMQKGHVFNFRNLQTLYEYFKTTSASSEGSKEPDVNTALFDFLLLICTSTESGLLRPSNGWYTTGSEDDGGADAPASNGTKLEVIAGYDFSAVGSERIQVRNRVLADFAQLLRPYAVNAERSLLIAMFEADPELVADYFQRKKSFTFDPKITSTWIGYTSVLFAIPQLPIPGNLASGEGRSGPPPPSSIVLESVIPQPLNAKILTKSLQNSSKLVQLFVVRILTCAFQKLQKIKETYRRVGEGSTFNWMQSFHGLETLFAQRCPSIGDVIALFRKVGKEDLVLREAVTRLLMLYFETLPQVALDEKLDISFALTEMLQDLEDAQASPEAKGMKTLQLGNLLHIAKWSSAVSWWNKPQALTYSPFLTLLKIAAAQSPATANDYRTLLSSIIKSSGTLNTRTAPNGLDALLISLEGYSDASSELWNFLDDCFSRFAKRPIKYQDDLDALKDGISEPSTEPVSLFVMTLVEQWPFRCKLPTEKLRPLAMWLSGFVAQLAAHKENTVILQAVMQRLSEAIENPEMKQDYLTRYKITVEAAVSHESSLESGSNNRVNGEQSIDRIASSRSFDLSQLALPLESKKHPALTRLNNPNADLDAYIEDGHLSSLILYLSSTSLTIRRQTLAALNKFTARLEQTEHEDKSQIILLIKELLETYNSYNNADGTEAALPFIASVLASKMFSVLINPLHTMYPKLNNFLLKGPTWSVERLPTYFIKQILSTQPSDRDDPVAYWREVQWLLDWLSEGVRTSADITIMRNSNVWERVLDLFFDADLTRFIRLDLSDSGSTTEPEAASEARKSGKVSPQSTIRSLIVKLVCRAAIVDGGADSLVTRNGILAWIQVVRSEKLLNVQGDKVMADIEKQMLKRCDQGHLATWSSGSLVAKEMASGPQVIDQEVPVVVVSVA